MIQDIISSSTIIQDIISSSTIILYVIPLILFMNTYNIIHLIGLVGLIGTVLLSEFIKYNIVGEISPRPYNATNCNLFCNDGKQGGRPGMPSSHAAIVGFFGGFYYQQTDNIIIQAIVIGYGILVVVSRYIKQCHSIEQIIIGSLLGIFLSIIVMRLF